MNTPDTGTLRETWAHPGYRRLVTAWTVGNIGDSALYITAAIWVKVMTGSDSAAAAVFLTLGLPAFLSPFFGLLADRFPRKRLLVVSNVATSAVVLLLLLVGSPQRLWLVFVVVFLYAGTAHVNAAAQSGLLKDMLPERLLAPANGTFSSIDQSLRIVGPLAGAAAFGLWGMAPVVLATAACFLAGAALLLFVPVAETVHHDPAEETWWQRTTAGFTHIHAHPRLRAMALAFMLAMAAGGVVNSTVFSTVDTGLGMPAGFLSVMVAIQGVASVASGLSAAAVIRRLGFERTIVAGSALFAVGLACQSSTLMWVVLGGVVPFAAGIPLIVVAAITLRQQELPARVQGRGAAAMQLLVNGPQTVTAALTAALLGVIDYRALIAVGVVFSLAAAIPVLRGSRAERPGAAGPARIPAASRPAATPVPGVAPADLAVAPGPTSD